MGSLRVKREYMTAWISLGLLRADSDYSSQRLIRDSIGIKSLL